MLTWHYNLGRRLAEMMSWRLNKICRYIICTTACVLTGINKYRTLGIEIIFLGGGAVRGGANNNVYSLNPDNVKNQHTKYTDIQRKRHDCMPNECCLLTMWPKLTGRCSRSQNAIPKRAPENTEHTVYNSDINYHSQKSSTRALLVTNIIILTLQRWRKTPQSSTGKIVPTCVHSWQAVTLRHLSTNMSTQKSYESGRQMSQHVILPVVMVVAFPSTFLRPWAPSPPPPPRLSQRYTQPFIARETISIQKSCGGCTVGWAKWRAERRDVTISTALP
jgi:hypothetical protein